MQKVSLTIQFSTVNQSWTSLFSPKLKTANGACLGKALYTLDISAHNIEIKIYWEKKIKR